MGSNEVYGKNMTDYSKAHKGNFSYLDWGIIIFESPYRFQNFIPN